MGYLKISVKLASLDWKQDKTNLTKIVSILRNVTDKKRVKNNSDRDSFCSKPIIKTPESCR